jgi:hypothetical protein
MTVVLRNAVGEPIDSTWFTIREGEESLDQINRQENIECAVSCLMRTIGWQIFPGDSITFEEVK